MLWNISSISLRGLTSDTLCITQTSWDWSHNTSICIYCYLYNFLCSNMQIQYCNNIRLSAVTDWMRFMSLAGLEYKMLSWWFNPVCALYWWTLYIIREWNKEKSRYPDLNDFTTHYRATIVDYPSQSAKTNGQYGNLVLELSQKKGAMDNSWKSEHDCCVVLRAEDTWSLHLTFCGHCWHSETQSHDARHSPCPVSRHRKW